VNIDVIGGSGFIGTRLVARIKTTRPDWNVRIIDKRESATFPDHFARADVRSLEELRGTVRPRSVIVNLAAEHRDDVRPLSLYEDVNVTGAKNICQVADEKAVPKVIFTSSVAVYGFAPLETNETGNIRPFNEYGRTKFAAEGEFRKWQAGAPARSLTIVRPTVVFGERNRGNVYNLLRQLSSSHFVMIGSGQNRKSIAYVENVAAFLEHAVNLGPGVHLHNYIDKPDFSMDELVREVRSLLGLPPIRFRVPYSAGFALGKMFDLFAAVSQQKLAISSIRVKKFCANSTYQSSAMSAGFVPPVHLADGLARTVRYEFLEKRADETLFYSE
jgi:GlcNAc-P-P-Und epimerase